MKVNIETNTNGKSKHTEEARLVIINKLTIGQNNQTYFPGDPFQGELRAHFEPHGFTHGSWNVEGYGLIVNDRQWLKEFKAGLRALGLSVKAVQNVKYNVVEVQGNDYVSLEVGQPFWASWQRLEKKAVAETFLVNA